MGETIMVLIIFFFLLVFGIVFYTRISINIYENKKDENADLLAVQVAQKTQFLPEIQCTQRTVKYNCVDIMKLLALKDLDSDKKKIYTEMFPRATIVVEQIYPTSHRWKIYEDNRSGRSRHFFPVPVAIYNATSKKYNFGYINITVVT